MVAGWVLLVVPVLIFSLAMGVYALPRVAATAWASLGRQWAMLEDNLATGDTVGIPLRILSILAIALPVLASVYLLIRLVRSVARGVWRSTEGKPVRRGTAALAALAILRRSRSPGGRALTPTSRSSPPTAAQCSTRCR